MPALKVSDKENKPLNTGLKVKPQTPNSNA
jgi:hypothetical protein